jgi:hypothetical protein
MWNISRFSLYDWYCMIDIDAGPSLCSRGRAQTQAFPDKCLDESFAFQCVKLVPQGWASSMVYRTLRWAHHTSHHAPLHTRDVYEINAWLWNFGRPQPRVGGLSIAKTERIRIKSRSELHSEVARRTWKTKNAWKLPAEHEESSWRYMTCIYLTYTYHIWLLQVNKTCISRDCVMSLASERICTYWLRLAMAISLLFLQ